MSLINFIKNIFSSKKSKVIKAGHKSVSLYCVAHPSWAKATAAFYEAQETNPTNERPPAPLTVVATKQEAMVYCDQYYFIKNYPHFKLWCQYHNYDNSFYPEAWKEYRMNIYEQCFNTEEDLNIYKLDYDQEQIARIIRYTTQCLPVGAPWEDNEELLLISELDPEELPRAYYDFLVTMNEVHSDLCEHCKHAQSCDHTNCQFSDFTSAISSVRDNMTEASQNTDNNEN